MEENDNAHPVYTRLRCVFFDGSIWQLILISQSVPSIPGRDHPRDGHWSDNATTRRSICLARPVKSVNYSNELLLLHVTSPTPQYAYGRALMFYASAKGSQSRLQARKTLTAYFRPVVFILVSLMIPQTVRGRPRRYTLLFCKPITFQWFLRVVCLFYCCFFACFLCLFDSVLHCCSERECNIKMGSIDNSNNNNKKATHYHKKSVDGFFSLSFRFSLACYLDTRTAAVKCIT